MQPEHSTYGTDAETDFFYKASIPKVFVKSLNNPFFSLYKYVITIRAIALKMCLLHHQKSNIFLFCPKQEAFEL
ncbi:hypothetical protein HDF22_005039 [Mucilaginibacter lappiensis]|uniref:Uncharacterized protein n=1 Tax=Mucilaginibacter lappiensis TaxID=354630 RepID=A0A841JIA1_9SPHI|nr:hypothetical protein [Mucilaginibacter lappiensis]